MRTPDISRPQTTAPNSQITVRPLTVVPAGSDPYPERYEAVTGVRQPADATHTTVETPQIDWWADEPFVVAASLKPAPPQMGGWPVASILIASVAQVLLGVAMATHYVPTLLGVIIAVAAMVCSLLLITAQVVCEAVGRDEIY